MFYCFLDSIPWKQSHTTILSSLDMLKQWKITLTVSVFVSRDKWYMRPQQKPCFSSPPASRISTALKIYLFKRFQCLLLSVCTIFLHNFKNVQLTGGQDPETPFSTRKAIIYSKNNITNPSTVIFRWKKCKLPIQMVLLGP